MGSGALVSPDLVLTVAHNIYNFKTKKFYRSHRVYIGQSGSLDKYYSIKSYYIPPLFMSDNDPSYDYGLIQLASKTDLT